MLTVSGIHSRSRKLIEATRRFRKGELDYSELEKIFVNDVKNFVKLQEKAEIEIFSDGMLNWHDLLRPLIECVDGIKCGPYFRWFETNTFYRQPIVVENLSVKRECIRKFFNFNLLPEEKKKIVILPGPYTCTILSKTKLSEGLNTFSKAIKDIIRSLEEYSELIILLHEPCLVYKKYFPDNKLFPQLKDVYSRIYSENPKNYIIHTYFGSIENVIELLSELKCWIGVDMIETSYHILKKMEKTNIMLGILDSQNPIIETPKTINLYLGNLKEIENKELIFCPNTDLRYLPRNIADKKILALKKIKEMLVN
ncbi:MAG: hypothetical protein H5T50_05295 [Nitrososphaeria archaeon]|nr:hypothetical protein [Nitrososphaeria archaeon]